jgi:hypothetical protein
MPVMLLSQLMIEPMSSWPFTSMSLHANVNVWTLRNVETPCWMSPHVSPPPSAS